MSEKKDGRLNQALGWGLPESLAKQASGGSDKVWAELVTVFKRVEEHKGVDAEKAKLVYEVSKRLPDKLGEAVVAHRDVVVNYVISGDIKVPAQVLAAAKYLRGALSFDEDALKTACGHGLTITEKDVEAYVDELLKHHADTLQEQRYRAVGPLIGMARSHPTMRFAPPKMIKDGLDAGVLKVLGPRTEEDKAKPKKGKKKKNKQEGGTPKTKPPQKDDETGEQKDDFLSGREIPAARNTEEQYKRHMGVTHGQIRTRFPPEPNGFLHLGHVKAMNFNFGVANDRDGVCYLRFDDTNPAAEKKVYIDNIIENVTWMGHKPWKVTYSSDYFQELYDLAVKMIKDGNAYVCQQSKEDMEAFRNAKGGPKPSPYRNRTVTENLELFEKMRRGHFAEGEATLRMKGDLTSPNPNMWDHVAYRIIYQAHPHVGDKWCIYPSYDYTHCIVDSLEDITHSLCTLEFEVRRESYFWLLDVLDLYKPKVWEYSRLNVEHNVMSKRKLKRMVEEKIVRGWNDPRLLTINGMRRKGFTARALRAFTDAVGVTRTENRISLDLLEHCFRSTEDADCPRGFAVVNPLKVVVTNFEGEYEDIKAPRFPHLKGENKEERTLRLRPELYIERSDFRMKGDDKRFYGLAPGKCVALRYAFIVEYEKVVKNNKGEVVEVHVRRVETDKLPKGKLHWLSPGPGGAVPAEIRCYNPLFQSKAPEEVKGDWVDDLNPESEVVSQGYVERSLASATAGQLFQFERLGYFTPDLDSKADALVFNRTCTLRPGKAKELLGKKGGKGNGGKKKNNKK